MADVTNHRSMARKRNKRRLVADDVVISIQEISWIDMDRKRLECDFYENGDENHRRF